MDVRERSDGHRKPQQSWTVLLKDHHPGYITWEQFERNQKIIAENAHMGPGARPKAGRGGRVLLSGLLRCRRCGRMLTYMVQARQQVGRYHCWGVHSVMAGPGVLVLAVPPWMTQCRRSPARRSRQCNRSRRSRGRDALQRRRDHRQSLELELRAGPL